MKTLKIKTLALAALLSLGFTASAFNGIPKAGNNQTVTAKIKSSISLPEELKTPGFSQSVKVSFEIGAAGRVQTVVAATKNGLLKQKLEAQFKQLALPELSAGAYSVEIDFIVY